MLFAGGMRSQRSESTTSAAYVDVDLERGGRRADSSASMLGEAGEVPDAVNWDLLFWQSHVTPKLGMPVSKLQSTTGPVVVNNADI